MRGDQLWGTIPRLVRDAAERYPDIEGIVDRDGDREVRWLFPELGRRIDDAARAFVASGVEPGDRVAVWAPNIHEWVLAAFGAHSVGAVLVPLNTRFKGREARYILGKSRARMLLTVTSFLDTDYVAALRADDEPLEHLEEIVVLRGAVPDGCVSWDDFLARGESVSRAESERRALAVTPDDLCHMLFTSGTTGAPKGAMLMHGPTTRAYLGWCDVVGLQPGDRYLIINPFFHSFGLNSGIIACLMRGVTILPHPVFDVPSVMRRVQEEGVTMLPGPPAIYQTILNHPSLDEFDLSSLRTSVTGAAVIPVEMIYRMRKELTFKAIITGYGLTETHGIVSMCRYDDDPETIARTSGRAIDDVEVLVVDDAGVEVPRGEPGEIVVRGYNLMRGYFEEPDATEATIDAAGWLHTGDIGTMDERGYLVITDRKKDMFIVGGFNAYPAEIENTLMAHPAVGAAAVVGVPDERLGEVGSAFVILRPGASASADEIVAWCRAEMANYKVPRTVHVVDAFPLNASGKVLKYELRQRAADAAAGGTTGASSS
jgi:acyl-CoA synthetase (AMP-forming)/AMP-acid ligase II